MTATGHAIIGTIIAAKFSNPIIAIPLAFFSHIAADTFPHWDAGTNGKSKTIQRLRIEATIDVLVGFAISYAIIQLFFPLTNLGYTFFMIITAQLLDWATMPYYFFNFKIPPFTWAYNFQKHFDNRLDKPWGIINQIGILLLLLMLAIYF